MTHRRFTSLLRTSLLRTLGLAVIVSSSASVPVADAADPEPCTIAVRGESPIAKACKEGGVRAAKRAMKDMVRSAREKGMAAECSDCHKGADDWTLTKTAQEKFRRMLELTK